MAVGLEGAQPQVFGQCESVAKADLGRSVIRRITMRQDLAEHPLSVGEVATFAALGRLRHGRTDQALGLFALACSKVHLADLSPGS